MPRYFFHVKRGRVTVLDQEGAELADIDEAAKEAARRGRGIIPPSDALIVANDQWQPLFEVRMGGQCGIGSIRSRSDKIQKQPLH
jgi:hypothetical protein